MKNHWLAWMLILTFLLCPHIVSLAAEPQTIPFDQVEDRTGLGYNTSMNFWYVGGEVAFSAADISIASLEPMEQCLLTLQVKSPVTDAVSVVARVTVNEITEELVADQVAKPGQGNQVTIDLSNFAGQTIDLEVAYVWAQSSLITVGQQPPLAQLCYEEKSVEQIADAMFENLISDTKPIFAAIQSFFSTLMQ